MATTVLGQGALEQQIAGLTVLLYSTLALRAFGECIVRRYVAAADSHAENTIFEKLLALSVLQKLYAIARPSGEQKKLAEVKAAEEEQSQQPRDPSPPPPYTAPTHAEPEHSFKLIDVHTVQPPLPPPTLPQRIHGSWLKFTNRVHSIKSRTPEKILRLGDAGDFTWEQIHRIVKDQVSLQLRLDSQKGHVAHFAFTQRKEDRAMAKLLSFAQIEDGKAACELADLPFCHHLKKRALAKVTKTLAKNGKARFDAIQRGEDRSKQPRVKTCVMRCSHCPSEYRLSVSLRRLTAQFGHSSIKGRVAPHFEWAQESSEMDILLERWVDLGYFGNAREDHWKSLVHGSKKVRRMGKTAPKWEWFDEHRERARWCMEGNDEVPVWHVKDMMTVPTYGLGPVIR